MTLTIEASIEPFTPGQFVNLGLDVAGESLFRAYSLASIPGAPLEFFLSEVKTGTFTPALFRLKVGDEVLVDPKPHGFFTLDWVPEAEDLWLIATGTGLGPFLSMLRSGEPFRRFSRVILVHGVRFQQHLAYSGELQALSATHAGRLIRVATVSQDPGAKAVLQGRLTSAFREGRLEETVGCRLAAERAHVMLCGNPAMIEEMLEILGERGLRRHRARRPGHITVEKYWE